jgi:hypothetical protein
MDSCPVSSASAPSRQVRTGFPAQTNSTVPSVLTATDGAGWLANTSPDSRVRIGRA